MPSQVARPEARWKRVRSPYDLRRPEHFHVESVEGSGPLTIITSGKPWHYAVGFRYQLPWYDRSCRHTTLGVVRLRATVTQGEISFGLADETQTFLDESIRKAGDGADTIDLLVPNLSEARWLVVRDGGEPGGPSRIVINRVSAFRLPPLTAGPELSAPEGVQLVPVPGWSHYYGQRFNDLSEKVRLLRYRKLDRPTPMTWLDGLRVLIHPHNEMSRALYISGLYEPTDAVVISRLLPEGGTFFDLGANMGVFSLLAARRVGPSGAVHAFEPSAREFGRLTDNLRLNNLQSQVRAERIAIADREGTASLRVAEDEHSGLNTLGDGFAYSGIAETGVESVPTITLDAYVRQKNVRRLDLIKMDVEGGEGRVLAGAREVLGSLRPRIVFEVNESALQRHGSSAGEVQALLAELGYSLWEIDDATAELRSLADVSQSTSSNVVAIPRASLSVCRLS